MKNTLILAGGLAILTSCGVNKKLEENRPSLPIPTQVNDITVDTSSAFVAPTINTFFADPGLIDLLQRMKSSNLDYKIVEERIAIANQYLKRSKMAFLPSIEARIAGQGTRYGKYTIDGVGNFDTNLSQNIEDDQRVNTNVTPDMYLGLQASWEIDIWGKLRNQKKAAQQQFFATQEGLNLLQVEIFTNIATLYYELIALDKQLQIYSDNLALQERASEIVMAQRSTGKATELAVQSFLAQNNNLKAAVEAIKADIFEKERAILALTGEFNGEVKRSANFIQGQMNYLNATHNVDTIIHARPDVNKAYLEYGAAMSRVKAARASFYPRLEIGGFIAMNAFSPKTWFNPSSLAFQFLGNLVAPIFNKGELRTQFNITTSEQTIAFIEYRKSVLHAYNELSAMLNQLEANQKVLEYKGAEVQFLERGVEVANDLYVTGYANYLEIITAQKSKLQAQLEFVDYQLRSSKALVRLYKAMGGRL